MPVSAPLVTIPSGGVVDILSGTGWLVTISAGSIAAHSLRETALRSPTAIRSP